VIKLSASIIDQYLFYFNLTKFLKQFCRLECIHIYKSLLSKHQYGYRPRPTTDYAVETSHSTLLNSGNGLYTCSVFIDLSKALDTVNFKILLEKLYFNFGIRGIPLQLFASYLSNRQHYTTIKILNVS